MKVTDNVITDLFPVYLSGEASRDTRLLVDEYLTAHPAFADSMRRQWTDNAPTDIPVPPDVELRSLKRTRHLMRVRSWMLAAAVYHTLLPFAFRYQDGQVRFLFFDSPLTLAVIGAAGALFWYLWCAIGRRLRVAGS